MADFLDYTGLKYYDKKLKEYFDKEIESQIDNIEEQLNNLTTIIKVNGLEPKSPGNFSGYNKVFLSNEVFGVTQGVLMFDDSEYSNCICSNDHNGNLSIICNRPEGRIVEYRYNKEKDFLEILSVKGTVLLKNLQRTSTTCTALFEDRNDYLDQLGNYNIRTSDSNIIGNMYYDYNSKVYRVNIRKSKYIGTFDETYGPSNLNMIKERKIPEYYDFALWQKVYAGRGSNAIAFFGEDGEGRITDYNFIMAQKKFLLQVGDLKYSGTPYDKDNPEEYNPTYRGVLYKDSVLQGLDTRPDDYRVFIYIPVSCNARFKMGKEVPGYSGGAPFWETYAYNCVQNEDYLLKYKFDFEEEYHKFYFTIFNKSRVFCFYRTVSEWKELFSNTDKLILEIRDDFPLIDKQNTRYNKSTVLFSGFSKGRFGLFKSLRDTFDMRPVAHSRPNYPLYTKNQFYNLYCNSFEYTWHLDPVKETEVKIKRHFLDLKLSSKDVYKNSRVSRSTRRIFRYPKELNLMIPDQTRDGDKKVYFTYSDMPKATIYNNGRPGGHEPTTELRHPGVFHKPFQELTEKLVNIVYNSDPYENPLFLIQVYLRFNRECHRVWELSKFTFVDENNNKLCRYPYVGPENSPNLAFNDNNYLPDFQIPIKGGNRDTYPNKVFKRKEFITNRPIYIKSNPGDSRIIGKLLYELYQGKVSPSILSLKDKLGGRKYKDEKFYIKIYLGYFRKKTKRQITFPNKEKTGRAIYNKIFMASKLQEYILIIKPNDDIKIRAKRGRIVDPSEIKIQF